ncbi:hypothetical protein QBC40DRAFT_262511 [Triangularia verruculosa]|uniref:NAD(P)-binding domain-containing protein n=1 Tax=Triangularia verruculosa TaxID=2587418 RepID=A0AAN7AZY7_9PEZI|nr:hypothetical protein QBC40DRAFT_262511 [Triangularia verruculosa]
MEQLTLLILGAGWTSTFLIPLLQSSSIPFAATTTSGRTVSGAPTIPFKFDPANTPEDELRTAISSLPAAKYVLITFPLTGNGPSKTLIELYNATHQSHSSAASQQARFIQLGSSGIWGAGRTIAAADKEKIEKELAEKRGGDPWVTRHSPINESNPRAIAENELLSLGGCVLNLSGLWGGERQPINWIPRVAATKEAVRGKTSLHLIHGEDIARAVVKIVTAEDGKWENGGGKGERWMLTDGFVYDWWAMLAGWAEDPAGEGKVREQGVWVRELMEEEDVRALPREMEKLGRCYDSREFWRVWGLVPIKILGGL